ncbi:MAG: hypothetical protein QW688_03155 [Thermoprotei archaeon]
MDVEVQSCYYCGSTKIFIGRDGFLTCGDCGIVLEELTAPQPSYTYKIQSQVLLQAKSSLNDAPRYIQECLRVYHYITGRGFTDPVYCVVPLIFILAKKPAEAASLLGIPEELAVYTVSSFLDGIPLNMQYGPKVFMPLRRMILPKEVDTVKLRLHSNGVMYVDFNGRVPLKPLYAGTLALKNPTLRHTLNELIAVRTRSGTVLCANVGCVPKQLPIKKRFMELLKKY